MTRIPPRLKRILLPAWIAGHRIVWRVEGYASALRHRRFERCTVCGRSGPILYRRSVIVPELERRWGISPRVAEALARKETLNCAWCLAKLRVRRLAEVLLEAYPVGDPPVPAGSVAAWVRHPDARALRIAEINRIEGLHESLRRLPGLSYSDFRADVPPGTVVAGVRTEDLTRLTYPDAAFDVVLTSETLEHVPDLAAALGEIRRVLVPGGLHLFTVPVVPGVSRTFARSVVGPDGGVTHLASPLCHPGGDVGYPVFTEFGADLPEILRRAGFEVTIRFGPTTEDDLAQVFVCRKTSRGSSPTTEDR